MSLRADTTQLITGLLASKYAGLGVYGEDVPDSGEAGPAPLYYCISLPTDNNVECRLFITRWPTEGILEIAENSSFTYTGDPDYFEGLLFFDGVQNTDDGGYGPGILRVQLGDTEEGVTGTSATTNANDFATATGFVTPPPITGTSATTNNNDVCAAYGYVGIPPSGSGDAVGLHISLKIGI